ncbi:MAG: hypothetical protein NTW53_01875 [Burkholderiales bacterium]|nr:hypothetical protein [Burkholderiales bacterium]
MNPVTDICWSCVLPIKIGAVSILHADRTPAPRQARSAASLRPSASSAGLAPAGPAWRR